MSASNWIPPRETHQYTWEHRGALVNWHRDVLAVVDEYDEPVAFAAVNGRKEADIEATLNLIAAAPDLLAALLAIANLDPASTQYGANEWGEADCWRTAREIAQFAKSTVWEQRQ